MAGVLPNAPTALYEDIKIGYANYIGVPDFVFVELTCLFLVFCQRVPALGFQFKLCAVACDEHLAQFGFADAADDGHAVHGRHFVVVGERHGEEEFVVLAAVEGAGGDVHIQFLGCRSSLVVKRYALLVEAAAHAGGFADVEHFGGKAVADVYHRRGAYAGGAELFHDVAARLGFEEAFQEILAPLEIGLRRFGLCGGAGVEHHLFALHELKPHVGCAEVTAHTNEVCVAGTAAPHDVFLPRRTDARETQRKSRERGGGVAAHDVYIIVLGGKAYAGIEFLNILYREAAREGDAHDELARRAVHGVHVGEVHGGRLVTEVLEGRVGEVEVDAFHEHVARYEHLLAGIRQDGAVVAHAKLRGGIMHGQTAGEAVYQPELSECGDFSSLGHYSED